MADFDSKAVSELKGIDAAVIAYVQAHDEVPGVRLYEELAAPGAPPRTPRPERYPGVRVGLQAARKRWEREVLAPIPVRAALESLVDAGIAVDEDDEGRLLDAFQAALHTIFGPEEEGGEEPCDRCGDTGLVPSPAGWPKRCPGCQGEPQ